MRSSSVLAVSPATYFASETRPYLAAEILRERALPAARLHLTQVKEVEVVTDTVTLTDAEAWLEVEYLGTSGFPLGVVANDRVVGLASPANQTSSSVAWTTTGLTTPAPIRTRSTTGGPPAPR